MVAERDAALHAARALLLQLDERERAHELAVVADALAGRTLGRERAAVSLEAADLSHHAASVMKRPCPPPEAVCSAAL